MPGSGLAENVASPRTIVCGTSAVTVNTWAADPRTSRGRGHHELSDIGCIARGAEAGLGTADPAKIIMMA